MSQTEATTSSPTGIPGGGAGSEEPRRTAPGARSEAPGLTLETERGVTTIADEVVAKVAGHACREVDGVAGLGTQFRRLLGRVRPGQEALTQGVNVEVGRKEAAVDLVVLVRFGSPIPDIAQQIRTAVIEAIEHTSGLDVVEVNIEIDDIVFEEKEQGRVA